MDKIIEQITALGKNVEVSIFFGRGYSYTKKMEWQVGLKLHDGETKIETEGKAKSFLKALEIAWDRIEQTARRGMPKALVPQIEHKAPADEEIPF